MKKKYIIIIISVILVLSVSGVMYYFWQSNNTTPAPAVSETTKKPTKTAVFPQILAQKNDEIIKSPQGNIQILPPQMQEFVNKIENVLKGSQTRESKILSLMDILRNSKSEEEKIATLQSLALLKPIEYADDLILIVKSENESNKVRAEALQTLSDAYSLTDEEIKKIGGSTVYVQMEKISQYIENVVNDKNFPSEVYNTALQSYAFMKPEQALPLAKNIASNPKPMTEAEINFFNATMFANKTNLTNLLPFLQKNPTKITDKMASQIAVMTADPVTLNQLSKDEKQQVIDVLKRHQLDKNNPMFQVETDTINAKIQEIEKSL